MPTVKLTVNGKAVSAMSRTGPCSFSLLATISA